LSNQVNKITQDYNPVYIDVCNKASLIYTFGTETLLQQKVTFKFGAELSFF